MSALDNLEHRISYRECRLRECGKCGSQRVWSQRREVLQGGHTRDRVEGKFCPH